MEFKIPDKSKEFVNEWAKRIQPLLKQDGKLYFFKNTVDHFGASYPWIEKPKLRGEATDLVEVARIKTLHTWAYYGFFKPTVAEVIRQIPEELLESVEYFAVFGPETADDLNREKEALDAGFHVAETILYRLRPEEAEEPEGGFHH